MRKSVISFQYSLCYRLSPLNGTVHRVRLPAKYLHFALLPSTQVVTSGISNLHKLAYEKSFQDGGQSTIFAYKQSLFTTDATV